MVCMSIQFFAYSAITCLLILLDLKSLFLYEQNKYLL